MKKYIARSVERTDEYSQFPTFLKNKQPINIMDPFRIYWLVWMIVVLTQTDKKNREHKTAFIQQVRDAVDGHDTLYLFSYENMRSNHFKNVRMHFREPDMEGNVSRIFLGKNKLIQIALGRNPEDEYADNLRQVSKLVTGSVGLLFTSRPPSDVEEYFSSSLLEEDFARAGSIAPTKAVLTNDMISNHPVSMVEQFRKLGMPVEVQNGKVVLINQSEFTVCREGDTLSAEACKILTHFGIKLATFQVDLVCRWSAQDGDFQMLS